MIQKLPQQLCIVLGEELQIKCGAINDQDALVNLVFFWRAPNGVQFNITTTTEDDSRTATSTLHISRVTHNYSGLYQCFVRNDGHQRNSSSVTSTTVIVEGNYMTS